MKIRKATKKDISELWPLEVEDRKYYKKLIGKKYAKLDKSRIGRKEKEEFIKNLGKDIKKNLILVIEDKKNIVGYIEGHITRWKWTDCKNVRLVYIENIAVSKNYRRKGLGTKLIRGLEKWAKSKKCFGISLAVLTKNLPAINLYKQNKFYNHSVYMVKRVK
ncbi:MAG: GNAT family N-acetyltransferase [archaeon]